MSKDTTPVKRAINNIMNAFDDLVEGKITADKAAKVLKDAEPVIEETKARVAAFYSSPEGAKKEGSMTVYAIFNTLLKDLEYRHAELKALVERESETRGVSEVVVKKQLPSAMSKEIGKFLGGRTRRRKTRRTRKNKPRRVTK
jgi:hypothetical protein